MSVSHSGVYPIMGRTLSKKLSSKMISERINVKRTSKGGDAGFIDWVHPLDIHPWMYAHKALRADFKDMDEALGKCIDAVKIGVHCKWMTTDFQLFWLMHSDFLHHHHSMEDTVFFPLILQRLKVPEHLFKEHDEITLLLTDLNTLVAQLTSNPNLLEGYTTVRAKITALRDVLEPHLQEEETTLMPGMLRNFTHDEIDVVECPAIRKLPWNTLPHFYRRLTKAERESHMTDILGIPKFVQSFILSGNFKKYEKYSDAINELKCPDLREANLAKNEGFLVRFLKMLKGH